MTPETATPTAGIPRLVDALAIARATGIPRWRLYELAKEGWIPHTRVGRTIRFDPEAVRAWIEAGGTAPREAEADR